MLQILSAIIGDALHDLRSALDYLVYALAAYDPGQAQEWTQFPIESKPEDFKSRYDPKSGRRCWLRGVNATHVAQIQKLQPYNGCQWTERLRVLSNGDKHRHLTVVNATVATLKLHFTLGLDRSAQEPEDALQLLVRRHNITLGIAFEDGQQVTPTLQHLHGEVLQTVETFKRELR